jgi:hypothetical protein
MLNSDNSCYQFRTFSSSRLLPKHTKFKIYKTINFPVVLNGCKTWYPTLKEEHRPREFENRVLRRISGQNRNEKIVGWRKLYNKELHNSYFSPNITKMNKSRTIR